MTRGEFFNKLLRHLPLPFDIDDVTELDGKTGMITVRNDEHPYIIKIEKLPIPSDFPYTSVKKLMSAEKEFFWADQSGRGYTNTFNSTELLEAFRKEVDNEEEFEEWIETCDVGDEYDSGTPNEIKRIK